MMEPCWIDTLSNELLLEIFRYLHLPQLIYRQRHLFNCILVNRRWHDLAFPLLWRSLHLDLHWPTFNTDEPLEDQDDLDELFDHPVGIRDRNELGVRPLHLEWVLRCIKRRQFHLDPPRVSPYSFCRYLSICARDHTWSDLVPYDLESEILDVAQIVLACNKLKDVDIFLRASQVPAPEFLMLWELVSRHLSKQPLSTFALNIDSLTLPDISPCFGFGAAFISFSTICHQVTHLSLTQRIRVLDLVFEGGLSNFKNLKSLEFFVEHGRGELDGISEPVTFLQPFSAGENEAFWKSIKKLPLEHIAFRNLFPALAWDRTTAQLPPTLRNVVLNLPTRSDPTLMLIPLRQLSDLTSLTVTNWQILPPFMPDRLPRHAPILPLGDLETFACKQFRSLHIDYRCPHGLLEKVAQQCPRLQEITFPWNTLDADILFIAKNCIDLKHVGLKTPVSSVGLINLCDATNLVSIALLRDAMRNFNEHVATMWALILPELKRIICGYGNFDLGQFTLRQMFDASFNVNTTAEAEKWYDFIDGFARADTICGKIDMMGMQSSRVCYIDMTWMRPELRLRYRRELDKKGYRDMMRKVSEGTSQERQ